VVLSAKEPARMRLLIGFFDLRTRQFSSASVMTACGTNAKSSNVGATAAFGGKSGRDMLSMSSSHFDPTAT
jgi:hypothetical protein